jgi:nitrate reductase gamma subunit
MRNQPFTITSLSSQFLEGDKLFWGSNLWHYGVLGVLLGHVLGFLMPAKIIAWNAQPVRLYILEGTGLALALMALTGTVLLVSRRFNASRLRAVTSRMDWFVLALLLLQVASGIEVALRLRWGSSWYASNAAPWLFSLCTLHPRAEFILPLPWDAKLHLLNAFLIVALTPFSRLVHALPVPLAYYWRRPQLVIWNRRPTGKGI